MDRNAGEPGSARGDEYSLITPEAFHRASCCVGDAAVNNATILLSVFNHSDFLLPVDLLVNKDLLTKGTNLRRSATDDMEVQSTDYVLARSRGKRVKREREKAEVCIGRA